MTSTALAAPQRNDDSELAALADLATEGFGGAVTRVQELHHAVADRSFGPGAAAPRAAHDAIAATIYKGVRGAGSLLGGALATAVRASGGGPRISDHPRGRLAQGALNGLYGDRLDQAGNALAVPMTIRAAGEDVTPGAFPDATPRPVVFVHGLGESDTAWGIRQEARGGTYATRVLADLQATPVTLRYNTGLSIAENGRRLSALLEDLAGNWPVAIERLALVGHSMGGLVIRSAAHVAAEHGHRWPELVDTTISLGTPHMGAPLEQAVHLAAHALSVFPESRPVGAVIDTRSVGIKDLRRGLRDEVPLIPGARHHVVAATLTQSERHPMARVIGDLLVLTPSAHGLQGRRSVIAFEEDSRRHVGGHDHFDLLNSPALDELLREWLSPGGAPVPARRRSGR
jgi:pimeloyl-ACP methyl ester carboxylesterase